MNSNHLSIHVNHFISIHIKPYHSIHINSNQSHNTFSKKWSFFCSIARNFCISKIMWLSQKRRLKVPGVVAFGAHPNMEEQHTGIQFLRKKERRRHGNLGEHVCCGVEEKWVWLLVKKGFWKFRFEYPVVSEFRNKKNILHQYLIHTFIALSMPLKRDLCCVS